MFEMQQPKKQLVKHQTQQLGKRILSCMIYHEKKKPSKLVKKIIYFKLFNFYIK